MEADEADELSPTCRPLRYRAHTSSVENLFKGEAQGVAHLYLALLPPELRALLDELLRASPWHFEPKLTPACASQSRAHFSLNWHLAVLESGERVIAWTPETPPGKMMTMSPHTQVMHIDRKEGDANRALILAGKVMGFIDLRPKEGIHILVGLDPYSRPKLRLHSLSGAVLAEWSAPETPPSHVDYDPRTGWLVCGDKLCHIARRERALSFPSGLRYVVSVVKTFWSDAIAWGANDEERLLHNDSQCVRVYNLASGQALHEIFDAGLSQVHILPLLGAVLLASMTRTRAESKVFAMRTGACLVHTPFAPLDVDGAAVIWECAPHGCYWSPRDPRQLNRLECGDWAKVARSGRLLLFESDEEYLLWVWGAATALRTRRLHPKGTEISAWLINRVAFLCAKVGRTYFLHMVPLHRSADASDDSTLPPLAPPTLPHHTAPLVPARELYRGPAWPCLRPPVGSEAHSPLVLVGGAQPTVCFIGDGF